MTTYLEDAQPLWLRWLRRRAILNNATNRSLAVLDEIGRGTSTYDGLAIAQSVVEYIHNAPNLGFRTLFATHYHEMTQLTQMLPGVKKSARRGC